MVNRLSGTGVWSSGLRVGDPGAAAEAAAEVEELGYTAVWVPDAGGDLFGSVENLLGATSSIRVCTGILNLWLHTPQETAETHARFEAQHGVGRFLVGIGISHAPLVQRLTSQQYDRPLERTAAFLDGLDSAPVPLAAGDRVLAALGPKMLELSRDRCAGSHPYLVTPEHTATARGVLGAAPMLLPEQAVVLDSDAGRARAAGRAHISMYLTLPNYTNNWRRLGFDESDLADGGSDRLVDALVAWGDEEAIASRVRAHRDAGADHVCIQVVGGAREELALDTWRRLAPVLNT